jgi:hypothetical protein
LTIDLQGKIELPDGYGRLYRQRLAALETMFAQGLANGLFNLALGGDPSDLRNLRMLVLKTSSSMTGSL